MYPTGYNSLCSVGKGPLKYLTADGNSPFAEWLQGLRDHQVRAVIRKRINRIRQGNFGDSKSVGDGVFELRVDYGPGFRVYFGQDGDTIVVLLCGGDKVLRMRI